MKRRSFLKAAAAMCGSTFLEPRASRAARPPDEKLILSAPLTHSDWMLKPGIVWGEAGVRQMLETCQAAGWTRIYWRVCDAGQATYASKLMRPGLQTDKDNIYNPQTDADREVVKRLLPNLTEAQGRGYLEKFKTMDYGAFDALASAVKIGHELGLEVHAWVSINEDDHGWGWSSEFSKANPQFRWIRRDGRAYRSQLSFAFEEVRRYKLGILAELLAYPIDGLFLDWIRTGDIRDNPQNDSEGIANYGYEAPNIEAFIKLTGKTPQEVAPNDERWARVRAEPQTHFMRAARELCRARAPKIPLAAMVGHPWHYRGSIERIAGNLQGLSLDVAAWAREGLVDSLVAAGYYRDGGTPGKAYSALVKETDGKVDLWCYAWVPQDAAAFEREFELASSLDARQILFWEADYIADRANAEDLKKAMSARSQRLKE